MLSEEGAYSLDRDELTADATGNLLESEFLADLQDDVPIRISTVAYGPGVYNSASAYLAVTKNGDLYCRKVNVSGACYEFPVNVSAEGNDGEYTVAPYVASGKNRPGDTSVALLYDADNDRFMGWDYETNNGTICFELPAGTINPGTTGKDLVYMEGTHLSNNTVFSILQDASGQRSIYAINLSNSKFAQEGYIENVQAENFSRATSFAFHSQYYYMFYASQDKLYAYDLGNEALVQTINLPGEEITMVKFDLFKSPNILDIIPEEMREQQYYLLVGSYKTGSEDGGILRMYRFNNTTKQLEEVENRKYEGFGRIVDVTYREQFIMTVPS